MLRSKHNLIAKILFFSVPFSLLMGVGATATDVDYNVNIAPALTLTTSTNSLALNLDPSTKTFDSKNLTISGSTLISSAQA